jgi:hypothetical protein
VFDFLCDRTKNLAFLVNCRLENEDLIRCGMAVFRGGLQGEIIVYPIAKGRHFTIQIPEEVKKVATWQVFIDSEDGYLIHVLPSPLILKELDYAVNA